MVEQRAEETTPADEERQSRAVIGFLFTLAITPIMALTSDLHMVPFEVALVAIGVGIGGGVITAFAIAGVDLGMVNDAVVLVVSLLGIVAATALVWVVVPAEQMPTFSLGTLAFIWSLVLVVVGRDVVAPRVRTVLA